MQVRHVAGTQRPFEHHPGDAVELHEHDAGNVGDGRRAGSPAGPAGGALVEPGVVVEGERLLTNVVTAARATVMTIAVQKPSR